MKLTRKTYTDPEPSPTQRMDHLPLDQITPHERSFDQPVPQPMRPDPRPGMPPNAEPKEMMDNGKSLDKAVL